LNSLLFADAGTLPTALELALAATVEPGLRARFSVGLFAP